MARLLSIFALLYWSILPTLLAQKKKKAVKKSPSSVVVTSQGIFPIKVSPNGRYLVDRFYRPFLMNADAGWMLLHKLTLDDAKQYMGNRVNKNFNTLFIQLLPPSPTQANAYGEHPFGKNNDFATPNERYFQYVEDILYHAAQLHLLVALTPAWLAGWDEVQSQNGEQKARLYGEYLGNRFKKHQNLLWIMGGARDPLREEKVQIAIAEGLKSAAPFQLLTYHAANTHSSSDVLPTEKWLDFSMIHNYFRDKKEGQAEQRPQVYQSALAEAQKIPRRAFVLGEAQHEDENEGTDQVVRRQAYWTMLSGGAGYCYGSSVWAFENNWQEKLNLPGANQMTYFSKIMGALPWYLFKADTTSQVLVEGRGKFGGDDYATVGVLPNYRMAAIYLPTGRSIQVNVEKINGTSIRALWISPRTNKRWIGGYFKPKGTRELIPPTLDDDWLLLLGNVGRK